MIIYVYEIMITKFVKKFILPKDLSSLKSKFFGITEFGFQIRFNLLTTMNSDTKLNVLIYSQL